MNGEQITGAVVMALCSFICAALFTAIGVHAGKSDKPVNFWSGVKVDPRKVTDVYAYNTACGRLWKTYSVPYWIAGFFGAISGIWEFFIYFSLAALILACVPGISLLIRQYNRIEKQYISR